MRRLKVLSKLAGVGNFSPLQPVPTSAKRLAGFSPGHAVPGAAWPAGQRGLTLVELMVAMALGLVIAAAAAASLLVARQGFSTVDSSSQLRENVRFSVDLIQRIVVQAGFEDVAGGRSSKTISQAKDAALRGFDNAFISASTALPDGIASESRSAVCGGATDTSCLNGSDVLVVRYSGVSKAGSTAADGSIINCAGVEEPEGADRAYSIFHIGRGASGEPALICSYFDSAASPPAWQHRPLASGAEGMQVLYGRDTNADSVPDQYVRASQLNVAGDLAATEANWQSVRSVRIGLLFRGPVGSSPSDAPASLDILGGAGFQDSNDVGATLAVAGDRRLRQQLVLTVHLRNPQGL